MRFRRTRNGDIQPTGTAKGCTPSGWRGGWRTSGFPLLRSRVVDNGRNLSTQHSKGRIREVNVYGEVIPHSGGNGPTGAR